MTSPSQSPQAALPRVIHFVTGGGSGATKVALDLACGHLRSGRYSPLLVLRRKKAPLPASMQAQIAATGLATAWVAGGFKWKTLRQLAAVISEVRPEIFVAHGNSEHLWGRQAAFAANVPVVVHVEHNRERYRFWRVWSARRLSARTAATVCVSHGVEAQVQDLRLGSPRTLVIHNGVDVARFAANAPPLVSRPPDLVMAARFARQKDQATLIRATQRLVANGWTGRLRLAGAGSSRHQRRCQRLVRELGLETQVEFLGQVGDIAGLYQRSRVAVLSTHHEGMPLALVESMAAGCAVVGSAVPGVTDVINPAQNGWLFHPGDDAALAETLTAVLAGGPAIESVVECARADAPARFSLALQLARYEALFAELLAHARA